MINFCKRKIFPRGGAIPPNRQNEGQEKVDIKRDDIREKNLQKAELEIKKRFGKNAIMRGISLEKGATAKERNDQIGGHKA